VAIYSESPKRPRPYGPSGRIENKDTRGQASLSARFQIARREAAKQQSSKNDFAGSYSPQCWPNVGNGSTGNARAVFYRLMGTELKTPLHRQVCFLREREEEQEGASMLIAAEERTGR